VIVAKTKIALEPLFLLEIDYHRSSYPCHHNHYDEVAILPLGWKQIEYGYSGDEFIQWFKQNFPAMFK
jgi:hypothetical protein